MKLSKSVLCVAFAVLNVAAAGPVAAAADDLPAIDLRGMKTDHVKVSREAGKRGETLRVTYLPAEWPHVIFRAAKPWDWHRAGRLVFNLANPGAEAIAFGVRVDDDPDSDGVAHCRTADGTIEAGASATFAVEFEREPMAYGMRGLPSDPGVRTLSAKGQGPFELRHVVAFQVFLHRPESARTLVLSGIRLAPPLSLDGVVDAFGQYARADWPGKLKDAADLARRRKAEEADLAAHPSLPDRDRFGGWAAGPRQSASGFFRTAKVQGRWWLVDPDGGLFVSTGINEVGMSYPTFVTGRASMFAALPGSDDPMAVFFGKTDNVHSGPIKSGQTFDFYRANLRRKYGPESERAWREVTLRRLPSWGFNTIGNWSEWGLLRNGRVPYVASAGVWGDHARVRSGSDYWGKMHDPFDPKFAADLDSSLRDVAKQVRGDPWCVGYFIDNELSWGGENLESDEGRYGLALGTLAEPATSPAKAAFLANLRRQYADVAKLNAAWGTSLPTWQALEAPFSPRTPFAEPLRADLAAFVREFAGRYFRTVRDRLRKLDPDHLYLGCRFAWHTPEAVAAAAESCDVVSFNVYRRRIDPKEWAFLNDLSRPAMITEFHFGALDRGMFHTGLVAARDQAERAELFRDYVGSVLDHPALVGCHWFQYVDEPLTGRTFDGENYNIGFVSVTDTPYPELVAAARAVLRDAYPRRFGTATHSAGPRAEGARP